MQLTHDLSATHTTPEMIQSVSCKFLFSREQFLFRHIRVPDVSERLAAIAHGDKYYSLFKTVLSAEDSLKFAIKASMKGNEVAITQAGDRYILWVHEADAVLAPPDREAIADRIADRLTPENASSLVLDTFSSAPCLIFTNLEVCKFCYFQVSGSPNKVPGFRYQNRCYILVQREPDAIKAVASIAERACRGIELAIVQIPKSYGIFALARSVL
jgi:hypothetical protein